MLAEERLNDREETVRIALDDRQANIWTSMPGIIEAYNGNEQTCSVQPSLQYNVRQKDDTIKLVTLPLLIHCPVQFIGTGDLYLGFSPENGDECLVSFAQRCIDSWWQNGGVQPMSEFRMHDISDGFVIPGFRSLPNVPAIPTPAGVIELRNKARTNVIGLGSDGTCQFQNTNGSIILQSNGNARISGNLTVGGNFSFGAANREIALNGDPVSTGGVIQTTGTQGKGS